MSIAQRSIRSTTWEFFSNLATIPINFIQSIVLARLLPIDYFGIYAGMLALVSLTSVFFKFGLNSAYLHRAPEIENEEEALSVLFTLRFLLDTIWAVILISVAFILFSDLRRLSLIVLTVGNYLQLFTNTPKLLLMRQVKHQRIAYIRMTSSILVAAISIAIAILTQSIWALLVSSLVTIIWNVILLYIWRPIWMPKFHWDSTIVKYYLNFGGRVQVGNILATALERIDDLWTNINLGDLSLGYYSRAFKFATYPRMLLAIPVSSVATTTFANLAKDRGRLSQAFFRVNALLVRSGFLVAGWLALVAPQLIVILLGERWLPMLDAFRLMLIYTMIDPLKGTFSSLLVVVGHPEKVITARATQLVVLIGGLVILGPRFNIAGVALAVNIMMLVGISILYFYVKTAVDFSLRRLIAMPLIGLFFGLLLTSGILALFPSISSDWLLFAVKSAVFIFGYLGILAIFEGKTLYISFKELVRLSAWFRRDEQNNLDQ